MTFWVEISVDDDGSEDMDDVFGEYILDTVNHIKTLNAERYQKANLNSNSKWERYLAYLHDWAWCHNGDEFEGNSFLCCLLGPASFSEWLDDEDEEINKNTFDAYGRI